MAKVKEKLCPGLRLPLSKLPSLAVAVCGTGSLLVQVTVVPRRDRQRRRGERVVLDRDGHRRVRIHFTRRCRRGRGCRRSLGRQRHCLRRRGDHGGAVGEQTSLWRRVITGAVAVGHQIRRDGVRSGERRFDLEDPAIAITSAVGRPGHVEVTVQTLLEVDREVETGDHFLQGG